MKPRPKLSTATIALAVVAALAIALPAFGLSSGIKTARADFHGQTDAAVVAKKADAAVVAKKGCKKKKQKKTTTKKKCRAHLTIGTDPGDGGYPCPYEPPPLSISCEEEFYFLNDGGRATGPIQFSFTATGGFEVYYDDCSGAILKPGNFSHCTIGLHLRPTGLGVSYSATLSATASPGGTATVTILRHS